MPARLWICLLLTGCLNLDTITLQGVVVDGWAEDAQPLGGATVRTLDPDGFMDHSTLADEDGWFRVDALGGGRVFVVVEGEDLVPASFSGITGLNPRFRLPNGSVYAVSRSRLDDALAPYAGCPGLVEGGVVFAEVRIFGLTGGETGEEIVVATGSATLALDDGRELRACYLNEDGVYEQNASKTGETGTFIVAGVPEGRHLLTVTYNPAASVEESSVYEIYMPEEGVVPRVPLFVELSR